MDRSTHPRPWPLGRALPSIVVLFALVDALLRLVPLEALSFRAWEALSVGHPATGPFAANRHYVNPRAYGDLATFGRRLDLRQVREERFTTDAFGFRNAPGIERADVILIGDSFGVGSGVSDDETLSAQLQALSGLEVYNAAGRVALHVPDVRAVAQRLRMARGTVVFQFMDRDDLPSAGSMDRPYFAPSLTPDTSYEDLLRRQARELAVSRLQILARREFDRLLEPPPPANSPVVLHRLVGGVPMLFLQQDVDLWNDLDRRAPLAPSAIDGWVRMAGELAESGFGLVVVLVPTKYAVYQPLLARPVGVPPGPSRNEQIASLLAAAGVRVVDVTEALKAEAARALARGELVYFADDTHWNARGIRVAAGEVAPSLRR